MTYQQPSGPQDTPGWQGSPPPYPPQDTPGWQVGQTPYGPPGSFPQQPLARYAPPQNVAPRNPALVAVASFFLPGLGQFLNGEGGKGIAFLASYIVSFVLMLVLIGFLTAPIAWIWSMVDAYNSARDWNTRHGIIS